jgi:hypothetical protein
VWDDGVVASRQRQLLAAVLLAAAALIATAAMSASASSPLKITNCFRASTRPKLLTLTCGDANTVLKGLRWSTFGGTTARATGKFVMNTCDPNCAEGRAVSFRVSVKATDPRKCKGGLRVYNKLALRFTGHSPSERNDLEHWTLGCPE